MHLHTCGVESGENRRLRITEAIQKEHLSGEWTTPMGTAICEHVRQRVPTGNAPCHICDPPCCHALHAVQPPQTSWARLTLRADAQRHLYFLHDGRAPSVLSSCLCNHDDMSEQEPLLPTSSAYDRDASKETTWREWTAELLESPRLHKTVIALARTSPIARVKYCPTVGSTCLYRS